MACAPTILKDVPLFALLDADELAVLAAQVELRTFAPRQRIYKLGDPASTAYVLVSGSVQVTTIDEDHQDVVFDQPATGEFFGFASMLDSWKILSGFTPEGGGFSGSTGIGRSSRARCIALKLRLLCCI